MEKNKLYVGNLPYTVEEDRINEAFSQYGEVTDVKLIRDRETGRSKGFAFVTFSSADSAESALIMNGQDLDGRNLRVNVAIDKRDRQPRY